MLIGSRIKEICKEKGISIAQLEREAGIPEKSISKWDKNVPSFDKVQRVLDALEISYEEFTEQGTTTTKKIQNALKQIEIASPTVYNDIMHKWVAEEATEYLTENESIMLDLFRLFNKSGQQIIITYIDSLIDIDELREKNSANVSASAQ